jgi:hypothetical protein
VVVKQCKCCLGLLGLDAFYRHPGMADGRLSFCKSCVKQRVAAHRQSNLERVRAYDRARNITPDRKRRREVAVAIARAFVAEIRAKTICAVCGRQPVEWHSDRHLERPYLRISTMAGRGYTPEKIAAEMVQCEPLCRRCHVNLDGRKAFLRLGPKHLALQGLRRRLGLETTKGRSVVQTDAAQQLTEVSDGHYRKFSSR